MNNSINTENLPIKDLLVSGVIIFFLDDGFASHSELIEKFR